MNKKVNMARWLSILLLPAWILSSKDEAEETCLVMDGANLFLPPLTVASTADRNESAFEFYFGEDLGVKQIFEPFQEFEARNVLLTARDYMQHVVHADETYESVMTLCKNQHESCATWALVGECKANPNYMLSQCAPVCQSCEHLSRELRCPLDPDALDALYPGNLNQMFERILNTAEYAKYEPKVFSRPYLLPGDSNKTTIPYLVGPWLVTFEKFITPEEASRLIELGTKLGYEPSGLVGGVQEDGSIKSYVGDEVRTSTNTWCNDECLEDPFVRNVTDRIVDLTRIKEPNYEFFQLLRYEPGQFYRSHTDLIDTHLYRQEGVRLLTFYMYLNDVDEGGGTNFPELNLTVLPKQGRAVLWPSVLNEDPNQLDERTFHQSLDVIRGVKYGANVWIHQRDFKTAFAQGCE